MNITVIGADRPLGAALAAGLGPEFEVTAIGQMAAEGCRAVDILERDALDAALAGAGAVVLAAAFDAEADSEQELLDMAARGAYVALTAAVAAGSGRVVLISRLDLLRDYPERYAIDPQWNPIPRANAQELVPLLAELTGREIARKGEIEVCCLRLGAIGSETALDDALAALRTALTEARTGHHWWVKHVASRGRFAKEA